jgi:sterol desaturase/sphingolipid hydroxylase (fatty acid hydroxylase superfamily)
MSLRQKDEVSLNQPTMQQYLAHGLPTHRPPTHNSKLQLNQPCPKMPPLTPSTVDTALSSKTHTLEQPTQKVVQEEARNFSSEQHEFHRHPPLSYLGLSVWPLMLTLPLVLTSSCMHYSAVFPRSWYSLNPKDENGAWDPSWLQKGLRHPLGLTLGIAAVALGHVFLLIYFRIYQKHQLLGRTIPIQSRGAVKYIYSDALRNHLAQPGGFLLLGLYLTITWVYNLLPESYYQFEGGIQFTTVAQCLMVQDFVQYLMHRLEHVSHPKVYRISHKPHHKFTNPKLFDAFDGSVPDTAIMILLPLFVTAHVCRDANVWTYMAFGSTYANWLTLIHSEVAFPWEPLFRRLGLGTAADHHVHHKFFRWNYGHLFMWWDCVMGTYRSPRDVWGKDFCVGV